ncbi:hypothetical protein FB451DRAFT_1289476 [Mycena latifolia]|nr:hypothetical protein FB451DRAFT_1289476 [Mycena latifolia]
MWSNTKHRKVVMLPMALALATTASGYVLSCQGYPAPSPGVYPDLRIFYALVFVTSVTLTGLIVGPILYARRSLRPTGQTRFAQRYNTAIMILLESAVVYLIGSSAAIVQLSFPALSTPNGNLCGLIFQTLMNMVPALAVLQISFGQARPTEGFPDKSGVGV